MTAKSGSKLEYSLDNISTLVDRFKKRDQEGSFWSRLAFLPIFLYYSHENAPRAISPPRAGGTARLPILFVCAVSKPIGSPPGPVPQPPRPSCRTILPRGPMGTTRPPVIICGGHLVPLPRRSATGRSGPVPTVGRRDLRSTSRHANDPITHATSRCGFPLQAHRL